MVLPDTIDVEHLNGVTDAELLEQLEACGYNRPAAEYIVDVLRGRVDPILD